MKRVEHLEGSGQQDVSVIRNPKPRKGFVCEDLEAGIERLSHHKHDFCSVLLRFAVFPGLLKSVSLSGFPTHDEHPQFTKEPA